MKREEFGTRLLTRVYANTQLQLMFWQMTYTKHCHVTKKLQSHTCYLTSMLDTIQHGATADNYVRIADCLHLIKNFKPLLGLLKLCSEIRFYELCESHLAENIDSSIKERESQHLGWREKVHKSGSLISWLRLRVTLERYSVFVYNWCLTKFDDCSEAQAIRNLVIGSGYDMRRRRKWLIYWSSKN